METRKKIRAPDGIRTHDPPCVGDSNVDYSPYVIAVNSKANCNGNKKYAVGRRTLYHFFNNSISLMFGVLCIVLREKSVFS